jgi:hypothetical protein
VISGLAPSPAGSSSRETWLAALLFTALTVVFAYPISLHPASLRFPTGPDGTLGFYILGWDTHAFFHKPWEIFNANIYYPQRLTLAYGENLIGMAFFAAPVIWLTGNLVLAANFVALLSCVLCGLGAYVLARRIGLSMAAGVLCGIIFECAPPRFFRIVQMPLSNIQWIPFALAALHAYLDGGRKRDLRLAAGFCSLEVLSSGHGAVFMGVSLLMFGLYRVLLGEPLRLVRRVRDLGVAGAVLLLPTFLVYLPYRAVQNEVGLKRGLGTWKPNYSSFLASPSPMHQWLLSLVTKTDPNATASAYLFPGYLVIVLAFAAIVWRGRTVGRDEGGGPSRIWTRTSLALERAILGTAAVAGALTAGTLIQSRAGTAGLADPRSAALAWILCACLAGIAIAMGRRVPADTVARHRHPLILLLAAALVWTLLGVVRPTVAAADGLAGEYFANPGWAGSPAFSVVDTDPSTDTMKWRWEGFPPEQFSVRWTGFLTVGRPGLYTFATTSDDASQLMVDHQLVVENSGRHSVTTRSGSIRLDRGSHKVELLYLQLGGDFALSWTWSRDGGADAPVPAWALSQRPTRYATTVNARLVDGGLWSFAILIVLATSWYLRVGLKGRGGAVVQWMDARRRDATTFYLVLTLVAFGLAFGPPYGLWQYVYWLPGFTFVRISSRFSLVGLLGLAVLAGIGFDRISSRLTRQRRVVLATAVGVLLVAEYIAIPLAVQPNEVEIPAIDRWLDSQPKPFVVAEVPLQRPGDPGSFEWQEVAYMIHSTAHWQKTVHGYSGWRTNFHSQLYSDMLGFPDETSVARLSDVGVIYVVVHTDLYEGGEWNRIEERLRRFSSRLRLEHVEGAGRVYSLLRPIGRAAR